MRKSILFHVLAGAMVFAWAAGAQAGYIFLADTDTTTAGLQQNPNLTMGNGSGAPSTSASISTAFGRPPTTGGAVSIFGGSGLPGDRYISMYSPDSTADNLVVPNGQALGEGNLGTGAVGGVADLYRIYATWPFTANVLAPGNVKYDVSTGGDSFSSTINQDDIDGASPFAGRGSVWVLLGTINYTSGAITVDQQPDPPNSAFVSMRFDALLFERVPEPTTLALLSVGSLLMMRRRQRIASRVVDDPTG